MDESIINSQQSLDSYKAFLDAQFAKHKYLRVRLLTGKQRTNTQNAALQVYCRNLARTLNGNGIDMEHFFKGGVSLPFTEESVKEYIWRPVQKALTGKESTTQPQTVDYAVIYDVINKKLSERGIYVPWPHQEK